MRQALVAAAEAAAKRSSMCRALLRWKSCVAAERKLAAEMDNVADALRCCADTRSPPQRALDTLQFMGHINQVAANRMRCFPGLRLLMDTCTAHMLGSQRVHNEAATDDSVAMLGRGGHSATLNAASLYKWSLPPAEWGMHMRQCWERGAEFAHRSAEHEEAIGRCASSSRVMCHHMGRFLPLAARA